MEVISSILLFFLTFCDEIDHIDGNNINIDQHLEDIHKVQFLFKLKYIKLLSITLNMCGH